MFTTVNFIGIGHNHRDKFVFVNVVKSSVRGFNMIKAVLVTLWLRFKSGPLGDVSFSPVRILSQSRENGRKRLYRILNNELYVFFFWWYYVLCWFANHALQIGPLVFNICSIFTILCPDVFNKLLRTWMCLFINQVFWVTFRALRCPF